MKQRRWTIVAAAACVICAAGVSQGNTSLPDQKAATAAVTAFLGDHGDLCLGKYTWPRDVSAADRHAGSNDAIQLPVLQRLGLVTAKTIQGSTQRYSLTAKGREYYLQKQRTTLGSHGQSVEHSADFCVARLTLDKVVKLSPPQPVRGHEETVAAYTYRIQPAQWLTDPQARRVFPVVDRIVRGAGRLRMTAVLQLRNRKWVSVLPGQ
jgi:hypothetical protein